VPIARGSGDAGGGRRRPSALRHRET
jgi:hypothetical protein